MDPLHRTLTVAGLAPDLFEPVAAPRLYYPHALAREAARQEEQRFVGVMNRVTRIPFPLTFFYTDRGELEVIAGGVIRCAGVGSDVLRAGGATTLDEIGPRLLELAEFGYCSTTPLPVPPNVVLGED